METMIRPEMDGEDKRRIKESLINEQKNEQREKKREWDRES